jgi:pimeloyl-ACP methyl ester carboxylesterase
MSTIETYQRALPHGITLSCRAAGDIGRPVLLFVHGFPEAAFVWDDLMAHFAQPANGGYRCIAPNLRGFERSSAPSEVSAYRPKHLVQDLSALIALETQDQNGQLACLVAHDWGGAVAWNLANQMPQRMRRLAILNSPHPGTFLRELKNNPEQQVASEYMNALIQPDAEARLAANDFQQLWQILTDWKAGAGTPAWLTETVKNQYRAVWSAGMTGGCNLYRASPLRPPRPGDPAAAAIDLPHSMLTIGLPTLVIWGMQDKALRPELVEGLADYIPDLTLHRADNASHWIVHEQPQLVARLLQDFLNKPLAGRVGGP